MRLAFTASLCLSVFITVGPAAAQSFNSPSSLPAADAAAKHAKRTACLKEIKDRRLVGAEKSAYLQSCINAPPQAISANRVPLPPRP